MELLALKRYEKPPETFFRDFIVEFHRNMDGQLSGPGNPSQGMSPAPGPTSPSVQQKTIPPM
jgi:hypothetical protein